MLWFGSLMTVMMLVFALLSYAFHARGQYDDTDRAMITTANHTALEWAHAPAAAQLIEGSDGFRVILRIVTPSGVVLQSSASAADTPSVQLRQIVHSASGPPYDPIAGLAPPITRTILPHGGKFSLITTPTQRWRVLVLPLQQGTSTVGYVEALTPLGQIDRALQTYRFIMLLLILCSLGITLLGSCFVARLALRPVTQLINSAQHITRTRDLSQRLVTANQHDDIGRMAQIVNTMLAELEQAAHAQQRFVADASHELRAPLTAILANLDLLRRHVALPEAERDEALAEAEREAARLARLVADLLALARADAGIAIKQQVVELDAIVLDCLRTAKQLAHGQHLMLDPFAPIALTGDEDRLRQVLLILVDNALKYTPEGGEVRLGLHADATGVEFEVQDSGIGIAPADLPHVCERFYRADPARRRDGGGTGLGLAIAQWIVTQHGGTLTLRSQLGQGTTATVRLPLQHTPEQPASHAAAHQHPFLEAARM
jgi:two-component system OmpR family sensor kinase